MKARRRTARDDIKNEIKKKGDTTMKELTTGRTANRGVLATLVLFAVLATAIALLIVSGINAQTESAGADEITTDAVVMTAADDTADGAADTEEQTSSESGDGALFGKAIGASLAVGLAAACAAIGMSLAISKTNEATARQPEMRDKFSSNMMLGFVFIETVVIYALVVGILVIFVL